MMSAKKNKLFCVQYEKTLYSIHNMIYALKSKYCLMLTLTLKNCKTNKADTIIHIVYGEFTNFNMYKSLIIKTY